MSLKLSYEMHRRALSRIFLHRPMLRNVFYGSVIFLALYGLLYTTAPLSLLPDYFKPVQKEAPPATWQARAEKVKEAFVHAYHGYEEYAAPSDELKPLTDGKINNFNGWGVTVVDSLDTMLLMGLKDEFARGLEIIKKINFAKSAQGYVPYFETIIRYLGGLLSAYALSNNPILLERAEDMVAKLDPIFDTPTGMPYFAIDPASGHYRGPEIGILAEIASLQLEYTYLAKLTGKSEHFNRSAAIMKTLETANLNYTGGMFPVRWNILTGNPFDTHLSVGAQADSAHEYLLKLYLLTGKTDRASLEMYIRATTHIITNLLYLSPTRNLLYVTDSVSPTFERKGAPTHILEHLSCFLPGLLALGAHTLPLDNLEALGINLEELGNETLYGHAGKGYKQLSGYNLKNLHQWAAEGIAQTCWLTYADQPTGLGPEEIRIKTVIGKKTWTYKDDGWMKEEETYLWMDAVDKWKSSGGRGVVPGLAEKRPIIYTEEERLTGTGKGHDYVIRKPGYLLRPETIESMYILWRTTGDTKWRERGWSIFQAIERETKTESGYASLISVDKSPALTTDNMPSYFLAETLKYLYLMFLEDDPISLDKWVFNTEAHPFPVFQWTEGERKHFNL